MGFVVTIIIGVIEDLLEIYLTKHLRNWWKKSFICKKWGKTFVGNKINKCLHKRKNKIKFKKKH